MNDHSNASATTITGDLGFETVQDIRTSLESDGKRDVVMDLSDVARIDSAGVALIVDCIRRASETGTRFTLRHAPERLFTLAEIYGVGEIIEPAVDRAVAATQ